MEVVGDWWWWALVFAVASAQATVQTLNARGTTNIESWPFSVGHPKATILAVWYWIGAALILAGLIASVAT